MDYSRDTQSNVTLKLLIQRAHELFECDQPTHALLAALQAKQEAPYSAEAALCIGELCLRMRHYQVRIGITNYNHY